jgi:two-component system, chemotaxis family, sensor kinase CheA
MNNISDFETLHRAAALLIGLRHGDRIGLTEISILMENFETEKPDVKERVKKVVCLLNDLLLKKSIEASRWASIVSEAATALSEINLRDTMPAPAMVRKPSLLPNPSDMVPSQDLIPEYVIEAFDHLDHAEAALLPLESDPENQENLNTVFRSFHTIKSTSGFMGFPETKNLAHLAEGLLEKARQGELLLKGEYADLALAVCDQLRGSIRAIGKGCPEPSSAALGPLIARLEEVSSVHLASALENPSVQPLGENAIEAMPLYQGSSTRVSTDRLEAAVNLIGELVIAHSLVAQDRNVREGRFEKLSENVAQTEKIIHSLQDIAMSLRMVPLKGMFSKMTRLVRDLARRSNKSVELILEGEETELDRNMVQEVSDPIIHLLRNAVDHGIEPQEERERSGKEAKGRLKLCAYHAAGRVVIEISDDGRGLDGEAIRAEAARRGLLESGTALTENDLLALIFKPGFSTAKELTDISGRGVGLDVVRQKIQSLRGRIEVQSRPGSGTTFFLRLPLTTAILDAMLLRVGEQRFLLPTISIIQSFKWDEERTSRLAGRGEIVVLRDEVLPVVRLSSMLGIEAVAPNPHDGIVMIVEADGNRCAVLVDELLSQQQVVIKPLDSAFEHLPGISGAAVLGDGRVSLILDAASLVDFSSSLGGLNRGDVPNRSTGSRPMEVR